MPHPLLIESFQTVPAFRELAATLPRAGEATLATGLSGSAPVLLVATLHRHRPERIWILVASRPDEAEQVAKTLGFEQTWVSVTGERIASVFHDVVHRLDLPFGDPVTAPQFLLGQAARAAGLTAVFNGEGGTSR